MKPIFIQELTSSLKSPAFWILLGTLTFFSLVDGINIDPSRSVINDFGLAQHNAALFIARDFATLSLITVFFNIILTARAVTKDFERNVHAFYFTTPLQKGSYLFGRFLGAFVATMFAFIGIPAGILLAGLIRGPVAFGPHSTTAFAFGLFGIALPAVLLMSTLFFSVATLSRNVVIAFLSGVGFLLLFGIGSNLVSNIQGETLQTLMDPTGLSFLSNLTATWTVTDINSREIPVTRLFWLNRLIFTSISGLLLLYTWRQFKFHEHLEDRNKVKANQPTTVQQHAPLIKLPAVIWRESLQIKVKALLHHAWREAWRAISHPAFLVLMFISLQTIYHNFTVNIGPNGSDVYPLTSWFLRFVQTAYGFIIPITIFFGGLFVWQDRDRGTAAFYDTLPNPAWLQYFSRFLMLFFMHVSYVLAIFLCGIFSQVVLFGYTNVEIPLYIKSLLGIELIDYLHIAVIVLLINTLVRNKYMGFFIAALFYAADIVIFQLLEVDNNLIHYGSLSPYVYSNLSGFGAYAETMIWYRVYWLFPTAILVVTTILFWQTGEALTFKERIKVAGQRFSSRYRIIMGICLALTVTTGGFIYYNENVIVSSLSADEQHEWNAAYEKKYKHLEFTSTPSIESIYLEVDLFPNQAAVDIRGFYKLTNKTNIPITEVLVTFVTPFDKKIKLFEIDGATVAEQDVLKGARLYRFDQPLVDGDSILLTFDYRLDANALNYENTKNLIAAQGNLINNYNGSVFFPDVGYRVFHEIQDSVTRAEYKLPHRPMLYSATDSLHASRSFRNFIKYEAIISSPADRQVISNGTLVRQWGNSARAFYHYKTTTPINNAIVISTGQFVLKTIESGNKSLQVYYDARHPYNIDRMLKGMQKSMAYCETNYAAYPYDIVRIVEVNRATYPGRGTATSLPTIFAWQEYGGFISNIEGHDEMDVVFNTTTHELAHQWWGNMILPAAVEGSGVMTESMAQWVRIMCLEQEYGLEKVKAFLEQELETYLNSRKTDREGERPLTKVQNQSYLIYNKGSLVMYALKEYLGEDAVNLALRRLTDKFALNPGQFVTVLDLIHELKGVTPDHLQYLISDLFENIILYDLSVTSAVTTIENGQYQISASIDTRKFIADKLGLETEVKINDLIPVEVKNEEGKIIYQGMVRIKSGKQNLEFSTSEKPAVIQLDPMGCLIERDKTNNKKKINWE
jgi:ABC-type transport system involved in multi-copper enzyme maturation permease subunit